MYSLAILGTYITFSSLLSLSLSLSRSLSSPYPFRYTYNRHASVVQTDPLFGSTAGFVEEYQKYANHTPTTLQGSAFVAGLVLMVLIIKYIF